MHSHRVFILDSRTENPCVGGSIPPLGTIPTMFLDFEIKISEQLVIIKINQK
jgi:hypothetical protein